MRKIIRFRGKVKGAYFLLRIDKIIPSRIFHFLANISDLSKWISDNKYCVYNDFYTYKFNYSKREELYEYVIQSQNLNGKIDYLEFGVSKGNSFKWWLTRIKNQDARFYGFDTFSGLPEDWGPFKKGDMNNGNIPPEITDNRHSFYQGLFQQTLIPFLNKYKPNQRKVIHIDADLYTSALYVLTLITPFLKSGDILFFDEFNVPMHEFKAFKEWTNAFYVKYKVLGGVNNFYQVAIMIE
jgi:O-methyltransferase